MNTTQKGDKLENTIYELFKKKIDDDEFVYRKESCKIFTQKGYYSKDRDKNIKFDVSIETYFPGEETYSFLTLIECKNYNHKVPVDDVEEFFAKIQQISPANTKGIIASTNSFQEGTFKFSKSKGIGLLRYFSPSRQKWELTRSPSSIVTNDHAKSERYTALDGLTSQDYSSNYFDCYCYTNREYTNSLEVFISKLFESNLQKDDRRKLRSLRNVSTKKKGIVKSIRPQEINKLCSGVLDKIDYQDGEVSLTSICEWLSREHNLKIIKEAGIDKAVLGRINFDPLTIYLNESESENLGRKRFTLAHEIGHFLLGHQDYMNGETCTDSDIDIERPKSILIKDIMTMEKQANLFASLLLLPKEQLQAMFFSDLSKLEIKNRGFGHLYLDNQPCNLQNYYLITNRIMDKFKVSRAVIRFRLINLGLLREESRKRPKQFITSYNTNRIGHSQAFQKIW